MNPRHLRDPLKWMRAMALTLTLALVVGLLPSRTQASPNTAPVENAITILQQYGIIQGDPTGNLHLQETITRAELATVLVRILGREKDAGLLASVRVFPDTQGHWANGYIALAQQLGLVKGYDNGTFGPDRPVSYAEALTMLLRLVGKEPAGASWPSGVLTQAVVLGLQPPNVPISSVASQPALRLHVFQSLFLTGTRVNVEGDKNLFQKYIDSQPPTITLDSLPTSTSSGSITISGRAVEATTVLINGNVVALGAGGAFQAGVNLTSGPNTIMVEAYDGVGNKATKTIQVTRAGAATRLEVTGNTTVAAGNTATYSVKAYDANGLEVGTSGLQVELSGSIGSFDLNSLTLRSGGQAATGTLTFKLGSITKTVNITVKGPSAQVAGLLFQSPSGSSMLSLNTDTTVQVAAVDAYGNVVTGDDERIITLTSSGLSGVSITPTSAKTQNGIATFAVRSTTGGTATLRASASGLNAISRNLQFATAVRVVLYADAQRLYPDGYAQTTVHARLEDQAGSTVINSFDDVVISLSASGPGSLNTSTLVIPRGYANSYRNEPTLRAGTSEGTLTIQGQIISGARYTVAPVTIPVLAPKFGADSRLEVVAPSTARPGDEVTYTVRLVDKDGALIPDGSFAFQIAVRSSNNEPTTNGIPNGMEIYLGNTSLNPVDDGMAEGVTNDSGDVIARTVNGIANIRVRYYTSGQVTLTAIPKGATSEAYDDQGQKGSAQSSTAIPTANLRSASVNFQGTPKYVKLEVDSALGNQQAGGALAAGSGNTATIRARIVDEDGNWIPGINDYTIRLNSAQNYLTISGSNSKITRDGYAEFLVRAGNQAGADTFTAVATRGGSALRSNPAMDTITVEVESGVPDKPVILATNGYKGEIPGEPNFVGTDDDGMEIVLAPMSAEGWSTIKVYRDGSSSPIYTTPAVNLNATNVVRVPKSALTRGAYKYLVVAHNSRGDSVKSDPSDPVTSAGPLTGVSINNAKFTSTFQNLNKTTTANVLTIFTSGSLVCTGTVNISKIELVSGTERTTLSGIAYLGNSAAGGCASGSVNQIQVALDPAIAALFSSAKYATPGLHLEAAAGWYESPNREQAVADLSGNLVTPAVMLARAEIDPANKRLYLIGSGFSTGTVDISKVSLVQAGKTPLTLTSTYAGTPSRLSDTKIQVPLTDKGYQTFVDTFGGASVQVSGGAGWFKDTTYLAPEQSGDLFQQVTVSSIYYDAASNTLQIRGHGFLDGQNDPSKVKLNLSLIRVKDWDTADETKQVLYLTNAKGYTITDTTITINMAGLAYTKDKFNGTNVFFGAGDGWYTSSRSIPAAGVPDRTYRVNAP